MYQIRDGDALLLNLISFFLSFNQSAHFSDRQLRQQLLHVAAVLLLHSSTAILSETYRISSELRSQATAGPVSTTVGDHVGIRGAVGSLLFAFLPFLGLFWLPFCAPVCGIYEPPAPSTFSSRRVWMYAVPGPFPPIPFAFFASFCGSVRPFLWQEIFLPGLSAKRS